MLPATNYLINVLGESEELQKILGALPVFKAPSEQLIKLIFNYGKITNLKKGETLIKEGDFDQWVHILLRGKLSVFVGEQWIDFVSESLVGERCILGETRKATLKAEEDDTSTFAIDMALMDVLENEAADNESRETLNELISVIADFVIARLIDLSVKQDISKKKLESNLKNMFREKLMRCFSFDAVPNEGSIDMTVYLFLRERMPERMKLFWNAEEAKPHYRRIYHALTESGEMDLLSELMERVYRKFLQLHPEFQEGFEELRVIRFNEVTEKFMEILLNELPEARPHIMENWGRIFSLSTVKLSLCYNLSHFLLRETKVRGDCITKVIISFMECALNFNMNMNSRIQSMNESKELCGIIDCFFLEERVVERERKRVSRLGEKLIEPYLAALSKGIVTAPRLPEVEVSPVSEEAAGEASASRTPEVASEPLPEPNDSETPPPPVAAETERPAATEKPEAVENEAFNARLEEAAQGGEGDKILSNEDLDALFN